MKNIESSLPTRPGFLRLGVVACLVFAFALPATAVTIEVHYAGRPPVVHTTNFLPATLLFAQLDSLRLDVEARLQDELDGHNIHSISPNLREELSLELIGMDELEVEVRARVYGGRISARYDCPQGTDLVLDVDFDSVEASSVYSLVSGLSPAEVSLPGLDLDVSGFSWGFGACSQLSIFNLIFGDAIFEWIEDQLEGVIENAVDEDILPAFHLDGFGGFFLAVDDYLEPIPQSLFDVIKLDKAVLLDVVTNPFEGIFVQVRLVQGPDGSFGAQDKIIVTVEVPWEIRPVPRFSNSAWNGAIRFDASGSLDPDGGLIERYHWDYGDGYSNESTAPVVIHNYAQNGTYVATLTTYDDEGARVSTSRTINTCSYLDCSGGDDNPMNPDIE